MQLMMNGQTFNIPTAPDGRMDSDDLRQAAGVAEDRPLIMQRRDGTNLLVNPGEKMLVSPGEYFMDAPAHRRGGSS